jgi:carbonic anhydrase/acetyltransferase-like protein (isoleucine patch superfamily)
VQNIDPSVWVHESSYLFGKLAIGEGSSVWPHVVMRAEMHHIEIGRMTNIQDFSMIHVGSDTPTIIGDFCSITHHCTIHGATIGDSCLIGINATIMDGAVIGAGSIVAG